MDSYVHAGQARKEDGHEQGDRLDLDRSERAFRAATSPVCSIPPSSWARRPVDRTTRSKRQMLGVEHLKSLSIDS